VRGVRQYVLNQVVQKAPFSDVRTSLVKSASRRAGRVG
jgi:hypothetical protein